jgi:ABC-type nitrate/sulfonate/bicarbonate transport system substrate-binding protein
MLRTVFLSTTTLALAVTAALAGPTSSMLSNGAAVTTVTRGYVTGGFYHAPA